MEQKTGPGAAKQDMTPDKAIEYIEKYSALKKEHLATIETLKQKEAFNFTLFQYNPEATVVVDQHGKVVKSNIAKRKSGDRIPNIGDTMYRDYAGNHSQDMFSELMDCIDNDKIKTYPQIRYKEKYLSITIAPFPGGAIITSKDITDRIQAEQDRIRLIEELKRALDEVERLRGLLPICASCKKIRDDKGYWNEIEEYFSRHSHVNFSHAMCPTCIEKLYPDIWERMQKKKNQGNPAPA